MSVSFRDRSLGGSKRHQPTQNLVPASPIDELPSPFPQLGINLSGSELRETAYEIVVAACRSSPKPLTFISQSEKSDRAPSAASSSPSLQRSLTSAAASKVKKALGLKSKNKGGNDLVKAKRAVTVGELMRLQMRVSEQTDSRIRRALLRVAAGQLGRRMESIVLPLELIQQLKSSDFLNQLEYEAWLRRNLKFLEAGLLLHPRFPIGKEDSAPRHLRRIIHGALEKPADSVKNRELMETLRNAVMSLACHTINGSDAKTCHWADGFPLNLRIYQMLLEACFDVNEETLIVEEVDDVLEIIKKTWVVLGVDEVLHNLIFSWILFNRFVATGGVENDLSFASCHLLEEVEKDSKLTTDPFFSKILSSISSLILSWADKRLIAYHNFFDSANVESMQSVVSLAVLSGKMLAEDKNHKKKKLADAIISRVDNYIRSSVCLTFSQKFEKLRNASKDQNIPLPTLCILAQEVTELAFNEKETFGPVLKRWHPLATGVAVATLHSCFGNELKRFVGGVSELTPDAIQVLLAAEKLEKDLVQIAVEDSVESEDGGISIIREMPPFEAEAVITKLAKSWIKIRVDRLKEWVDRNLQQEIWNPRTNKECFAPSAVEVLRIIDETLEAFFMLPIPMNPNLVSELTSGLDRCLEQYILKAKSGCGNRNTFVPTMPVLTRCSARSKFNGVFKKKDRSQMAMRKASQVESTNGDDLFGIPQLCVRVNTFQRVRMNLGALEKRTIAYLKSSISTPDDDDIGNMVQTKFEQSVTACVEGIQQLCETIGYKVIFHELSHVLWDGLYIGDVSSSRIEPFLQELEHYLELISSTVHDRVRTRVIADVMKASFDGYLLVLLAGGPSRAFFWQDSDIIEEDFKFLCDLFWSNGDGLPIELIDRFSAVVKSVLPLYHSNTESLIERYNQLFQRNYGTSAKSRLPLPPTTGQWNPSEPNTLLRVLCHRNDEVAAKFLKKTYNLPKKL